MMTVLTGLLVVLVAAGVASLLLGHRATMVYFREPVDPPLPEPLPSVAILKPVEGAGPETYEAFASFCRLGWPADYELWIGTIRDDDPIVGVVERLQADFPDLAIRLVFAELRGTNRKTSIMEALWRRTNADLIFFSDADVRVEPDYLRRLVPRLAADGVGCLTCLPRGVAAETVGGRMIALHYAFGYLPQWMLAMHTRASRGAIGHTWRCRGQSCSDSTASPASSTTSPTITSWATGRRSWASAWWCPRCCSTVPCRGVFRAACRRLLRWKRTMRRARARSSPAWR